MWTRFMDMHSGGGNKEGKFDYILIEAPQPEAEVIFYNRLGHNPNRVSCTCCGEDYSISQEETLEEATAYDRNCLYGYFFKDTGERTFEEPDYDRTLGRAVAGRAVEGRYCEEPNLDRRDSKLVTVEDYIKQPDVLVIRKTDIKDTERVGEAPAQGYVWQD